MNGLKEIMMKKAKEGKFLSEEDKAHKLSVLNDIKKIMADAMGDDLKGIKEGKMQKVTVASPTPEGLVAGLDKAEKVVEDKMDGESEESEDDDMPMIAEDSKEAKIKKLEEELAKLKA